MPIASDSLRLGPIIGYNITALGYQSLQISFSWSKGRFNIKMTCYVKATIVIAISVAKSKQKILHNMVDIACYMHLVALLLQWFRMFHVQCELIHLEWMRYLFSHFFLNIKKIICTRTYIPHSLWSWYVYILVHMYQKGNALCTVSRCCCRHVSPKSNKINT